VRLPPTCSPRPFVADTVCKSGNSFADALFTQGLMAVMQPIICCVRAQSAREFVTELSQAVACASADRADRATENAPVVSRWSHVGLTELEL